MPLAAHSAWGRSTSQKFLRCRAHDQPEFTFDTNTDAANWGRQGQGLHVAFGSTEELYLRSDVPALTEEKRRWEESAWRGERLKRTSARLVREPQQQIRFRVTELRDENGRVIEPARMQLQLVRYVLSNFPLPGHRLRL